MVPFMREREKIFTSGQATDDNIAHVHTHTHSEDVIFSVFARQQSLQYGASLLCFTYNVCLVSNA
jgi:hypothetical protein